MTCEKVEDVRSLGRRIDELDAEIDALCQQVDRLETERKAALAELQKARGFRE